MASTFSGRRRKLEWKDFGDPKAGPDPPAGVVATAAKTRATHTHSLNAELVPGSKPHKFRLKDDVTIGVVLQPDQMFVNAWVFRRDKTFQADLLHHEQGHYDLVALFCRDMFLEIMALKPQSFATANAVMTAVQGVFDKFDPLIKAVHTPYDDDTAHGRKPTEQVKWDGFINTAFTTERDPPISAPDGTAYKVPLLQVLQDGGVSI